MPVTTKMRVNADHFYLLPRRTPSASEVPRKKKKKKTLSLKKIASAKIHSCDVPVELAKFSCPVKLVKSGKEKNPSLVSETNILSWGPFIKRSQDSVPRGISWNLQHSRKHSAHSRQDSGEKQRPSPHLPHGQQRERPRCRWGTFATSFSLFMIPRPCLDYGYQDTYIQFQLIQFFSHPSVLWQF